MFPRDPDFDVGIDEEDTLTGAYTFARIASELSDYLIANAQHSPARNPESRAAMLRAAKELSRLSGALLTTLPPKG